VRTFAAIPHRGRSGEATSENGQKQTSATDMGSHALSATEQQMICLAVSKNGEPLCLAGFAEADLLTVHVSGGVDAQMAVSLRVGGMCELPGNRSAHLYWIEGAALNAGDRLRFELQRSNDPTMPLSIEATGSPEYLAAQAAFEELAQESMPRGEIPPICWPDLKFECSVEGGRPLSVGVPLGQDSILCSILWSKWDPERLRISLRTLGGLAGSAAARKTMWLRETLLEDQRFEVLVTWGVAALTCR
jgi:hypothetical protein